MTSLAPTLPLASGGAIPTLGLGTWPMDDAEATRAVATALQCGYRLVDTAENYENERGVGAGIRESGVPREEVFLTTKLNKKWHSVDGVRQACENSLERLGLDYLDLFLIHWPNPDQGTYVQAYEGLVALQQEGLVKAIGTSNFKEHHLQDLFAAGFTPEVNQVQLDPHTLRPDLVALHRSRGIVTEAWRPFGEGGVCAEDPIVLALAEKYDRTPHQVVLRWHVQNGYVTCPKSADPQRQASNLAVFDFELTPEDLASMSVEHPEEKQLDADTFGH